MASSYQPQMRIEISVSRVNTSLIWIKLFRFSLMVIRMSPGVNEPRDMATLESETRPGINTIKRKLKQVPQKNQRLTLKFLRSLIQLNQ